MKNEEFKLKKCIMETPKQKFQANPTQNPITGEVVTIGGCKYKKLTDDYGDVKIISPKTNSKINVGKGEYKKLLKEGYTQEELLALIPKIEYIQSPVSQKWLAKDGKTYNKLKTTGFIVETNDEKTLKELLDESSMNQIKAICKNNPVACKIVNNKAYWDAKYNQYQLPYLSIIMPETVDDWVNAFVKTRHCYAMATKLVNHIVMTKHFKCFEARLKKDQNQWLPEKLKSSKTLQFKIKTRKQLYEVSFYDNDDLIDKKQFNQEKFILYLTKLFYFTNNIKLIHDKYQFTYNQLKSAHDNVKKCFPQW